MSHSPKYQLLEILLERKVLSNTNVELIHAFMKRWRVGCYDAITETKLVSEGRLKLELAEHFTLESVSSLTNLGDKISGLEFLPFIKACELVAIPIGLDSDSSIKDKTLRVVMADPTADPEAKLLRHLTGCDVTLLVGEKCDIMRAIYSFYPPHEQLSELMKLIQPKQVSTDVR